MSKVIAKIDTFTTGGKTVFIFYEHNTYFYKSEESSGICDWRWHVNSSGNGKFQGRTRHENSTWFTLSTEINNKLMQATHKQLANILEA